MKNFENSSSIYWIPLLLLVGGVTAFVWGFQAIWAPLLLGTILVASLFKLVRAFGADRKFRSHLPVGQDNRQTQDDNGKESASHWQEIPEPLDQQVLNRLKIAAVEFDSQLDVLRSFQSPQFPCFDIDKINGSNVISLLYGHGNIPREIARQMEFHFRALFGMGPLQWKISAMEFVRRGTILGTRGSLPISFQYFPIYNQENTIDRILIVIEDASRDVALTKADDKVGSDSARIRILFQVTSPSFKVFIEEAETLVDGIKQDLNLLRLNGDKLDNREIVDRIFRGIHTIRGNARLFKISSLDRATLDAEAVLTPLRQNIALLDEKQRRSLAEKITGVNQEVFAFASLRKDLSGLIDNQKDVALSHRLAWIKSLMQQFAELLRDPNINQRDVDRIQNEFNRAISGFNKASLMEYVAQYQEYVEEISNLLDKRVAPIVYKLDYKFFDSHTIGRINDILIHCLHNALDHGLETMTERVKIGKPSSGQIYLESKKIGGQIYITIRDDGRGIDSNKVVAKAIERGLLTEAKAASLSEAEKLNYIFEPGLSTAVEGSKVSGQGVGLDAVRTFARDLGGEVVVETIPGSGTSVTFSVPENSEGFASPYAIFNLQNIMVAKWEGHKNIVRDRMEVAFEFQISRAPLVLGDQISVGEIFSNVFLDLLEMTGAGAVISCHVQAIAGRRKVDSYEFFRARFSIKSHVTPLKRAFDTNTQALRRAGEVARRHGGSVIITEEGCLDVNLPSFMPVQFSGYTMNVLVVGERMNKVEQYISETFKSVFGGWSHRVIVVDESHGITQDVQDEECIVILRADDVALYNQKRSDDVKKNDSVILIVENMDELDSLGELKGILPDHVIFTSAPIHQSSITQAVTTIVLRRFASEVVNRHRLPQDRGLDSPLHMTPKAS